MTFHKFFGNHREKYVLDYGTITYLNTRITQSFDSLIDISLSLEFKKCGSLSISIYFLFYICTIYSEDFDKANVLNDFFCKLTC